MLQDKPFLECIGGTCARTCANLEQLLALSSAACPFVQAALATCHYEIWKVWRFGFTINIKRACVEVLQHLMVPASACLVGHFCSIRSEWLVRRICRASAALAHLPIVLPLSVNAMVARQLKPCNAHEPQKQLDGQHILPPAGHLPQIQSFIVHRDSFVEHEHCLACMLLQKSALVVTRTHTDVCAHDEHPPTPLPPMLNVVCSCHKHKAYSGWHN